MNTNPTPDSPDTSPDPDAQLHREIYLHLISELMSMLPAPISAGPDPDKALARRIKTCAAQVAAMLPANAEEVGLAVRVVAAAAHHDDCLRESVRLAADPTMAMRLRAQAISMGREERGYRSLLLRLQRLREKREANDKTREAAEWTEHCVAGLVTQAVAEIPADEIVAADTEKREARLEAAADRYAVVHPRRAQVIRRARGMPEGCGFGPPGPALLRAIVSGDSRALREADALPYIAT